MRRSGLLQQGDRQEFVTVTKQCGKIEEWVEMNLNHIGLKCNKYLIYTYLSTGQIQQKYF